VSEVAEEPQVETEESQPEEPEEPDTETEPEGRCEAETTAGGTVYRCALEAMHDGEHSFTPLEDTDTGEEDEQAATDAAMLDANKKVARAAQTYWNKVREQYGGDLGGFHECPLCVGYPPGLYWPSELPAEKAAALKTILGQPALENYKRANAYGVCATCDGLGTVLTGSMVPAHMTHQCVDCTGRGYIAHEAKWEGPARSPILDAPVNGGEEAPAEAPAFDPWGRPHGDPDYYRMPIAGVTT
jgi:hypothetical protein